MRTVREGGHRFLVNLSDYLDTGLFLDHRRVRAMIDELAARQDVPEPVRLYRLGHGVRGRPAAHARR